MKRNRPKQRVGGSECIERRATTMRRWRDVRMTVNLLFVGRARKITQCCNIAGYLWSPSCVISYHLDTLTSACSHFRRHRLTKESMMFYLH